MKELVSLLYECIRLTNEIMRALKQLLKQRSTLQLKVLAKQHLQGQYRIRVRPFVSTVHI